MPFSRSDEVKRNVGNLFWTGWVVGYVTKRFGAQLCIVERPDGTLFMCPDHELELLKTGSLPAVIILDQPDPNREWRDPPKMLTHEVRK